MLFRNAKSWQWPSQRKMTTHLRSFPPISVIDNLIKEIDAPHQNDLVFMMDYGNIEDVDSSALANIIDRLKNDVRCDHRVLFINVPEKFKDLLELFKLQDSIEVYDSQEDAEKALGI